VASWESPIYAAWLAAIRDVNQGLPPNRRLRVLAGDTAVDWQRIHSHTDWEALGDNNLSFADVVVNYVLRRGHRALVVLGTNHVRKSSDRDQDTTSRVESSYPGSTYVVLLDNLARAFPPAGSLEPAYMKEIDRRSWIEWGELRARRFLGAAAE
jgi:hypothetical protein